MMEHILVCDFDEKLIRSFQSKAFVIKSDDPAAIPHIYRVVSEENKLHCLQLNFNAKLSALPVSEEWRNIPIHVFATRFGIFREFVEKAGLLRQLSTRLFLSTDIPENIVSLQIIASLGIDCGLFFGQKPINWEALNDLMYYSVYGKAPHATIEPFNYVLREYRPNQRTDFNSVYFENPERYLHINSEGKGALNSNDLLNKNFIIEDFKEISKLTNKKEYKDHLNRWQDFFLKEESCATCPAWRVCLGKFHKSVEQNPGCTQLFSDLMDGADFYNKRKGELIQKELCQP